MNIYIEQALQFLRVNHLFDGEVINDIEKELYSYKPEEIASYLEALKRVASALSRESLGRHHTTQGSARLVFGYENLAPIGGRT